MDYRSFITIFTGTRHCSCPEPDQFSPQLTTLFI